MISSAKPGNLNPLTAYVGAAWLLAWIGIFAFTDVDATIGVAGVLLLLYTGSLAVTLGALKYVGKKLSIRSVGSLLIIGLLGLLVAYILYYYIAILASLL